MIASSVWLSFSRGRSWSCDQCRTSQGLRKKRGNCGGAFNDELPMVQRDERGLYVPGYRVCPDSGSEYSDMQIRSCPVAGANRLASIISAYHRHRSGLYPISSSHLSRLVLLLMQLILYTCTQSLLNIEHSKEL